jgi:hypothetical protein
VTENDESRQVVGVERGELHSVQVIDASRFAVVLLLPLLQSISVVKAAECACQNIHYGSHESADD